MSKTVFIDMSFALILGLLIVKFIRFIYKLWERVRFDRFLRERWLQEEEPKHRNEPGYPIDWVNRRKEIERRSNYKCAFCGCTSDKYHIHHIIPLSKSGDHSLSNLELLCEDCHISKHPNLDAAFQRHRLFQEMGLIETKHGRSERKAKFVKKSTVEWECALCKNKIMPGQSYYGNYYTKLCIKCSPLRIKKLASSCSKTSAV